MGTGYSLIRFSVPPGICIGQGQLLHIAQRGERTCVIQLSRPQGLCSYWPWMQMQTEVRSMHGMFCTDADELTRTSVIRQKPTMARLRFVAVPATCAQVCACVDVHVRLCVVWVAYLDRCPTYEAWAARRVGEPDARLLNQVNAVIALFFLGVGKRHEHVAPLHKHEHTKTTTGLALRCRITEQQVRRRGVQESSTQCGIVIFISRITRGGHF